MQTLKNRIFLDRLCQCKGDKSPPPAARGETSQDSTMKNLSEPKLEDSLEDEEELILICNQEYAKEIFKKKIPLRRVPSKRPGHKDPNQFIPCDTCSDHYTYIDNVSSIQDIEKSRSKSRGNLSRISRRGTTDKPKTYTKLRSNTVKSSTINWSVTYTKFSALEDKADQEKPSNELERIDTNVEPYFNLNLLDEENQVFLRKLQDEREHFYDPPDQKSRIRLEFIMSHPQTEDV